MTSTDYLQNTKIMFPAYSSEVPGEFCGIPASDGNPSTGDFLKTRFWRKVWDSVARLYICDPGMKIA